MSKLKLGPILDEKPVKLTVELPASTYRDLVAYGEALHRESSQTIEPAQMVAPMLARFMASDRAFAKTRRIRQISGTGRSDRASDTRLPDTEPIDEKS